MKNQRTDVTHFSTVLDSYNKKWTPAALLADEDDAQTVCEWAAADADARVSTTPYYETADDALSDNPSQPPADATEFIIVFTDEQDTGSVAGVFTDDGEARDFQIALMDDDVHTTPLRSGGWNVFTDAKDVAEEKPELCGQFIYAEKTAEDLLDSVQ